MKTFKKLISVILCVLTVFSFTSLLAFAESENLNYLVLGDSIAKGFGVKNSREASYGRIVANTNGYNYINRGFAGCTSEDLLENVKENEYYRDDIEWADIISISVGGNDFLLDNAVLLVIEGLIFNNPSRFQKIGSKYYENIDSIVDEIHSINPDAVILFQTLYNAWRSPITSKVFRLAADTVNDSIITLYENKGGFYIVDIAPIFEGRDDLITSDTIHPNAKANVLMAEVVLQTLYDLGLGTSVQPYIAVEGEDRDYLIEYFVFPLGHIITFAANLATGNLF